MLNKELKNYSFEKVPECAVCLQSCNHPAQLPCGHIFCFLCAKGVAIQNKRCAMCRQDIPPDYLDHPVLLESSPTVAPPATDHTDTPLAHTQLFQWYYEGRNGWWKYDERSNSELEAAYSGGETQCQLLLAGALYHVDLATMLQVRRSDVTRRRRVKRDVPVAPAKGIAGIKMSCSLDAERDKRHGNPDHADSEPEPEVVENGADSSGGSQHSAGQDSIIIPPPPQFSISDSIRSLSLDDDSLEPPTGSQNSNTERD